MEEQLFTAEQVRQAIAHAIEVRENRTPARVLTQLQAALLVTKTMQETADALNASGVPTVKGGPWTTQTIHSAIARYGLVRNPESHGRKSSNSDRARELKAQGVHSPAIAAQIMNNEGLRTRNGRLYRTPDICHFWSRRGTAA